MVEFFTRINGSLESNFVQANRQQKRIFVFNWQKMNEITMRCMSARTTYDTRTWACHTRVTVSVFTIQFLLRSVVACFESYVLFQGSAWVCRSCAFVKVSIVWHIENEKKCSLRRTFRLFIRNQWWLDTHTHQTPHDLQHFYACPPEQKMLPNKTWELCKSIGVRYAIPKEATHVSVYVNRQCKFVIRQRIIMFDVTRGVCEATK